MLHGLKRTNGPVELLPLHRVFHRLVEHVLGSAEGVCCEHDPSGVDHPGQHVRVFRDELCGGPVQRERSGAAGFVDGWKRFGDHPGRPGVDEVGAPRRIRDQISLGVEIQDGERFAGQRFPIGGDAAVRTRADELGDGDPDRQFPCRQA